MGTINLNNVQPLDSDLTAIAGLSPSNDDIIQRKSGAWINRTLAQYRADLALVTQTITDGVTSSAPSEDAVYDALALKENSQILGRNITAATISTTGADEITHSIQVAANKINVGDIIELYTLANYTSNANAKTYKIWLNTSNSLSGATLVGTTNITTGSRVIALGRIFAVKSNTILISQCDATSSLGTGKYTASTTIPPDEITVPSLSAGIWFIVSASKASAGDTAKHWITYVQKF